MAFVRLYNADTDAYWDAPEESVTHWTSLGWTVADDAHEPAPAKSAPKDEWVAHAEAIGVPTTDADGNELSKAAIQAAVEEAAPPATEGGGPLGGEA